MLSEPAFVDWDCTENAPTLMDLVPSQPIAIRRAKETKNSIFDVCISWMINIFGEARGAFCGVLDRKLLIKLILEIVPKSLNFIK